MLQLCLNTRGMPWDPTFRARLWRAASHCTAARRLPASPALTRPSRRAPRRQALEEAGESGDDGYVSVGGASPASLRAWLRHMREFTYQVGGDLMVAIW